jgi:hypothetical protein
MNIVHVKFEDSSYNYSTSVSAQTDEESARKYFVGTIFNLGHLKDDLQTCIDIVWERGDRSNIGTSLILTSEQIPAESSIQNRLLLMDFNDVQKCNDPDMVSDFEI